MADNTSDALLLEVAGVVRKCLAEGFPVEIEGLGTFRTNRNGVVEFIAELRQKVFIAYSEEDLPAAERLYHALEAHDFDPWLDKKKLLPGQNWPRAIQQAIEVSDFFIACLSKRSVGKRGYFQSELRYALDCAARLPFDDIFLLPVRVNDCTIPEQISKEIQYVDLFPVFEEGLGRIFNVMRQARKQRRRRVA